SESPDCAHDRQPRSGLGHARIFRPGASRVAGPLKGEARMSNRRDFLRAGALAVGGAAVARSALAAVPEAPTTASAKTQPPLGPANERPYKPVVTLNGWTLPWRMKNGWKEFHLVAEPVVREIAPGMKAHLWGYNGQSPGPTIECVEGDR